MEIVRGPIHHHHMEIALWDRTLPTLEANLAADEALLLEAEAGRRGEVLRFWEWPTPAVVLGAGGQVAAEANLDACDADSIPILRRASGGGTVLLGAGCLVFSLVLRFDRDPALRDVNASYRFILGRTTRALAAVAPLALAGICDLALDGRKVSGNAQQRKRDHLLHHGTLLYRFDISLLNQYLRMPERQPDYRGQRTHEEFVINLSTDGAFLKQRLANEWEATTTADPPGEALIAELIDEKYARPTWNRRR
jgi:lipoate-protein ligase A